MNSANTTKSSDNLISALKSHAVFKVATVYAISGWLLIQFADIGLEAFDAPDWAMRFFLIVVLAGFPISLIASRVRSVLTLYDNA